MSGCRMRGSIGASSKAAHGEKQTPLCLATWTDSVDEILAQWLDKLKRVKCKALQLDCLIRLQAVCPDCEQNSLLSEIESQRLTSGRLCDTLYGATPGLETDFFERATRSASLSKIMGRWGCRARLEPHASQKEREYLLESIVCQISRSLRL